MIPVWKVGHELKSKCLNIFGFFETKCKFDNFSAYKKLNIANALERNVLNIECIVAMSLINVC